MSHSQRIAMVEFICLPIPKRNFSQVSEFRECQSSHGNVAYSVSRATFFGAWHSNRTKKSSRTNEMRCVHTRKKFGQPNGMPINVHHTASTNMHHTSCRWHLWALSLMIDNTSNQNIYALYIRSECGVRCLRVRWDVNSNLVGCISFRKQIAGRKCTTHSR